MCLLLSKCKIAINKNAIGYFGYNNNSVSSCSLSIESGKDEQLNYLKAISTNLFNVLDCYYRCKKMINNIALNGRQFPKRCHCEFNYLLSELKKNSLDYYVLHSKPRIVIRFKLCVFSFLQCFKQKDKK